MGEGGCTAEYFLNRMTVSEAVCYIKGLNRRHRQDWERTRMLCRLITSVLTGEELDLPFPWDEEEDRKDLTEDELDALRERARMMEKLMNGG